ncbi:MAG: hypothetical protein JWP57_220, partial [Spirosoma sp.]|nr:hypothetical protein [Spirosoma sp.]
MAYDMTNEAGFVRSNTSHKQTKTNLSPHRVRYFFVAMAVLFPIITFLGFFPSLQDLNAGSMKVHWLTHVHSAIMTSWIVVFLAQAILAAKGNLKFHRRLGLVSVVLGVLVCLAMVTTSVHFLIANHPPERSFLFDLVLIEIYEIASFGLFFTWGIQVRTKDPSSHKRLLMLATFVLLTAAVDRIHWLPSLGMEHPSITFVYLDMLLIPLFFYDFFTFRRIHRTTWIGSAVIIMLQLSVNTVFGSPLWHKRLFNLTTPLMEQVNEVKLSEVQSAPLLGDYESPTGKMTISRNRSKLYIQFNDQEKQEMGAKSETELFLKTESMDFSFEKGT